MSRKIKKNGVMTDVSLDKNKKYKYSATGDLVEATGELGDNEISMSGSKSSLRRAADMERNISILATTMLTTDNGAGVDSPAEVKAAASADATTKANNAKSQAISAASSDATTKANTAKSQAISAAATDATTKADAALQTALANDSDTTYSVGDGGLTQKNFTTADNAKLDGIATSANNYSLPSSVVHSSEKEALHGTDALRISGHTISLYKGNGTSESVVVPDNNTTYSAGTGISLSGTTFSADSTMSTKSYADDAAQAVKTTLLGGAGQAFDTLSEIKTLMDAGDASLTNAINSLPSPGNGTVTVSSGTGMSGGGAFSMNQGHSETVTLSHADTSSQGSVNNGGRTYIQDITLDTMGHITGITSATETVVNTDTNTTYTAAQMLTAVKTVDGSGSGLDADLLDGQQGSYYYPASNPNGYNNYSLPSSVIHQTELSSSVSSTSTTVAANSAAVKAAYDRSWPNTTYNFSGSGFTSRNTGNALAIDSATTNQIGYCQGSTAAGFSDGAMFVAAHSTSWVSQIFSNFRTGELSSRGKNSGTWGAWRKQWDSLNDGAGSGLDADLLDGQQGSYYYPASNPNGYTNDQSAAEILTKIKTVDGSGSGLDADTCDGQHLGATSVPTFSSMNLRATSNAGPCKINFSDNAPSAGQNGTIAYVHSDGSSYGSGNAFKVYGTEASMSFHVAGTIMATGEVTAYYSDERLKNFSGKIENALDKVSQLNGYHYTGNDVAGELGYDTDVQQVGVSAQEVEAVLPEVVKSAPINGDNGTDYKTVQYERMVPLLIESIKELKSMVESQAAEIAKLKK